MTAISQRIERFINALEQSDEDLDSKLSRILENEIRRRLNRYFLTDRLLTKKYDMGFEEFRNKGMVEKMNYSFEVESDFCDWEMALTGIKCLREDLAELSGKKE